MKEYIKYQVKQLFIPSLIITLISIIAYTLIIAIQGLEPYHFIGSSNDFLHLKSLNLYFFLGLLTFLIFYIPMKQTSYLKSKRASDLYFSFPINRTKLLITNLLLGLLQLIFIFTVVYWIGFLIVVIGFSQHKHIISIYNNYYGTSYSGYHFIQYIPLYFFMILLTLIPYTIFTFIYTKANSKKDGLVLFALYSFVIPLISTLIQILTDDYKNPFIYTAFSPLFSLTNEYIKSIESLTKVSPFKYLNGEGFILSLIIFSIISIVFAALMVLQERKRKNEEIDQITSNYFGFKILLPINMILTYATLSVSSGGIMNIAGIFLGIFYLIIYMLYQKNIKMKPRYYIIWAANIILGLLIGLILSYFQI